MFSHGRSNVHWTQPWAVLLSCTSLPVELIPKIVFIIMHGQSWWRCKQAPRHRGYCGCLVILWLKMNGLMPGWMEWCRSGCVHADAAQFFFFFFFFWILFWTTYFWNEIALAFPPAQPSSSNTVGALIKFSYQNRYSTSCVFLHNGVVSHTISMFTQWKSFGVCSLVNRSADDRQRYSKHVNVQELNVVGQISLSF